jgi:hypothetical protein
MPKDTKFWSWVVFAIVVGAYLPLFRGGWQHPIEMNLAGFGLWTILSLMLTYSAMAQRHAGWSLPFGCLVGNVAMVVFGLFRGGYTFNIGMSETIVIYGISITLAVWATLGALTKRWNPRILFLGAVVADMVSYYPQLKQYVLPHEHPTGWALMGWTMFGISSFISLLFVERLPQKCLMDHLGYALAYDEKKDYLKIAEQSAYSLENFFLIIVTVSLMSS